MVKFNFSGDFLRLLWIFDLRNKFILIHNRKYLLGGCN